METGETSFKPIADFDNRRPEYKADQKKVIDSIKVKSVDEIDNILFKKVLEENKNFYGLKIFTPDEKNPENKLYFRQNRNNIAVVQDMITLNDGGLLVLDSRIVDMDSKKVFNVFDLVTIEEKSLEYGRTGILYSTDSSKISTFKNGEKGGFVNWNENELQIKAIDLLFGKGIGGLGNILLLFHEFGHRFQFKNLEESQKIPPSFKEIFKNNHFKKKDSEYLTKGKQLIEEKEINAWDFSLSIMDKLKSLGLDLSRGLDKKQIDKGVRMCLSTYKIKNYVYKTAE